MLKRLLADHVYLLVFSISFFLLHFFGVLLSGALLLFGIDKIPDVPFWADLLPLVFYAVVILFYMLINRIRTVHFSSDIVTPLDGILVKFAFAVFVVALTIYIAKSGVVLFASGGYENRYSKNLGLGLVSQLLIFFYFGFAIWLRASMLKGGGRFSDVFPALIVGFLFCVTTFVVLGGHRQLGFGVFFVIVLLLFDMKKISTFQLSVFGVLVLLLVIGSAVFRYDVALDSAEDVFKLFIIYVFDGITPVDAYYNIYLHVERFGEEGGSIVSNLFLSLVPRFLWEGKPEIMMSAGNVYTQEVLGRSSVITYSPTMLGELLLVHGTYGALIAAPLLGGGMAMLDKLVSAKTRLGYIFLALCPLLVFNLYREGFYVFIKRGLLYFLFIWGLFFIGRLWLTLNVQRYIK